MNNFDAELARDLAEEMTVLSQELAHLVMRLKENNDQPALFEKFGQIIDRIYGTAATFGMKELASYCGTLKEVCYGCASARVAQGYSRVLKLMETYIENVNALIDGVTNPEAMKKLNFGLHLEEKKAKKIQEEVFRFTKK